MKLHRASLVLLALLLTLLIPPATAAELRLAIIKVKGMVCDSWPISVATVLERLPGVKRAMVNRQTEEARVVYDDSKQTPEKLAAAIGRLGFQASVLAVTAAPKPTLYVEGLNDLNAVRKVEQLLKAIKGVKGVTVDPKDGEVFVEYDTQAVSPRDLVAAVNAAGFKARPGPP